MCTQCMALACVEYDRLLCARTGFGVGEGTGVAGDGAARGRQEDQWTEQFTYLLQKQLSEPVMSKRNVKT